MTDPHDEGSPLGRLGAAGFDLSQFDDGQLELLAALSADEVSVLLDIRERIGDVRPEVEAHSRPPSAACCSEAAAGRRPWTAPPAGAVTR